MPMERTVGQWRVPGSENRRRVGDAIRLMFQQVRKAGKRGTQGLACEKRWFGMEFGSHPLQIGFHSQPCSRILDQAEHTVSQRRDP